MKAFDYCFKMGLSNCRLSPLKLCYSVKEKEKTKQNLYVKNSKECQQATQIDFLGCSCPTFIVSHIVLFFEWLDFDAYLILNCKSVRMAETVW